MYVCPAFVSSPKYQALQGSFETIADQLCNSVEEERSKKEGGEKKVNPLNFNNVPFIHTLHIHVVMPSQLWRFPPPTQKQVLLYTRPPFPPPPL